MAQNVIMIGAFDTKGAEYAFLRERLLEHGLKVTAVNTGVMNDQSPFSVEVAAAEVATAGGADLAALRKQADRGAAMKTMAAGAAAVAKKLHAAGQCDGIIGMGGTGGSSVVTAAMRALPLGVPKVCLSTVASGDTSSYVGVKDVVLIPSIVDVAGLNRISRRTITQAAGALAGMIGAKPQAATADRPIIAASMFGNTTKCVNDCAAALDSAGYEVLVFHATGAGGKTMESLVDDGLVDAVLDITTTEWADTICGGVFDAGPERLDAPGRRGIPHLIVPGCVDMCNFGPRATVPAKYNGRLLYEWNPSATLMRTNVEENREMGRIFAEKANKSRGPVAFLIPLRGVSILDGDGERFCDRAADAAMFDAIKGALKPEIVVEEMDCNINDPPFAARAVEMMLQLIKNK